MIKRVGPGKYVVVDKDGKRSKPMTKKRAQRKGAY